LAEKLRDAASLRVDGKLGRRSWFMEGAVVDPAATLAQAGLQAPAAILT